MKKFFILFQILLFITLISSCGMKPTPTVEYRYIEEKTELSSSFSSEKYGDLLDSYVTIKGDIFSLYCKKEDETNTFTVTKRFNNGISEEPIPLEFDEMISYLFICPDSTGNILLADTSTIYLFKDETGESCLNFPAWAVGGMIIADDNTVICQSGIDSPYCIFDLSTGNNKGIFIEKEFLFERGKCQPFLDGFYGQEILVTNAGIYTHIADSWVLQVSANGTSMSKSDFLATKIEKDTDNTYVVYDSNYQYTYLPEEINKEDMEKQITLHVTAWQNRDTLKTALAEYQIANPNVTIEYTFRCDELPETEQEANSLLQITNAEIVSSQAADIYVLDYLPWEKYQEKGLLMDLSDMVIPYAENEEYFGNILTAYETDEGLYAVPWFFSTKYILCRQELTSYVQNIHELAAYLEDHPEDPGLVPYYYHDMPELFLAMIYDFYGDDLYENDMVTLESVESFLSSAKIIYERQQENTTATILPNYSKNYYSYSYLQQYPCGTDIQLLFEKQDGSFLLLPSTPMGVSDLLKVYHHPDYAMIPIDGIHTQFLFGIHSKTKEPEVAEDLLKFLLSYFEETGREDRSIDMFGFLPGFPIYKPILSGQLDKYYITEELEEHNPLYHYTSGDTEKLFALIEEFHKPGYSANAITDDIYSIFQERSRGYLTGEKSLEESADEVYNGLMLLYLENQ